MKAPNSGTNNFDKLSRELELFQKKKFDLKRGFTLACVSTEIPGNDGKAGLLAIDISTANEEVVVADFCQKMKNALPGYAVPVVLQWYCGGKPGVLRNCPKMFFF